VIIAKTDNANDRVDFISGITLTIGSVTTNAGTTGDAIVVGGVTLTATFNAAYAAASDTLFYVGATTAATATNLAAEISNNATLTLAAAKYIGTATDGVVNVTHKNADTWIGITSTAVTAPSSITAADVAATSELSSIQTQYNDLLTQLTALAEDSGYKGKNLLSSDTLTVKFEGTTLSVAGFDASATGLALTNATWTTGSDIAANVTALDNASTTLRTEASKLSGNLSIITVRQSFSTNMINTLNTGSDLLTLADANEEGANMLMLQTRQSLSTTALSLSAQAAQSVLKLFA